MKTPEEIAKATISDQYGGGADWRTLLIQAATGDDSADASTEPSLDLFAADVLDVMVKAIQADRAQRFTQTSSSDRHARIRELLAEFDAIREPARQSLEIRMAEALRAALPPETIETPDRIRDRLFPSVMAYAAAAGLNERGLAAAGLRVGIIAGMEAADQSWEPDDYAEPETVAAALRRALLDRGDKTAADYVIEHQDEVWGELIGPMLDALQRDHGAPEADPWGSAAPEPKPRPFVWDAQTRELVRSDARLAIRDRSHTEYDEHDERL